MLGPEVVRIHKTESLRSYRVYSLAGKRDIKQITTKTKLQPWYKGKV